MLPDEFIWHRYRSFNESVSPIFHGEPLNLLHIGKLTLRDHLAVISFYRITSYRMDV